MFNENKIWHSVKARRDFHRKQRNSQTRKRRRLQHEVCEKRFVESRPFFRKSKFQTERHDQSRYNKIVRWFGEGEKARALYHKEVHPRSNEFWWENQFNHEKYITVKGRAFFRAKQEAEERQLRDNFKVFLDSVPQAQHKRLKAWLKYCDHMDQYATLFEEDGIDENEFLAEDMAYSDVAWHEILPVSILRSIVFLSKQWPINTIPRAIKNVEVGSKPISEPGPEPGSEHDTDEDEFFAGF